MTALFDLDDVQDDWAPIYNSPDQACRDCGRTKYPHHNHCQGNRPGHGNFVLCDDCAALDSRGQRLDAPNVSRWGIVTTDAHAAALTETRARHRANYWATLPGRN